MVELLLLATAQSLDGFHSGCHDGRVETGQQGDNKGNNRQLDRVIHRWILVFI